uniref:Uncharacterized protein n=1 Tax=Arundo donax TaxID=35708 RepID=A0A0A9E3F8_ARUDO
MTQLRYFHVPRSEPASGPKARSAHRTKPPLPGSAAASSAVTSDSGTPHAKGKTRKPRSVKSGPAARTARSEPYGPPATSK